MPEEDEQHTPNPEPAPPTPPQPPPEPRDTTDGSWRELTLPSDNIKKV